MPEERWRDEEGKLDESLMLVSASGRFNGPLRNYDAGQLDQIRAAIAREQDMVRHEHLQSALVRGGLFHLCPEEYVIVDPKTEEGREYLAKGMSR
ncbi:MAG: hypothetical protein KatS3mg087_0930 [Patescibacteria group bacterium]|nr:MAG: hypothetical protein KatS3mg087_0930 [Patescibacteria group bacterium]